MDANQPVDADSTLSNEWETWGHEPIIDLCEVQVGFDGNYICELIPFAVEAQADSELALTSRKLAPIRHEYGAEISNLKFVCTPPTVSNGESSQSADHVAEKGQVSLLAAFLNFDNCEFIPLPPTACSKAQSDLDSSAPQSHLSVYTVSRATEPSVLANSSWVSPFMASQQSVLILTSTINRSRPTSQQERFSQVSSLLSSPRHQMHPGVVCTQAYMTSTAL